MREVRVVLMHLQDIGHELGVLARSAQSTEESEGVEGLKECGVATHNPDFLQTHLASRGFGLLDVPLSHVEVPIGSPN